MRYRNSCVNANSVDTDYTPRSAAFDLDLHNFYKCLIYGTLGLKVLRMTKNTNSFQTANL